MRDYHITFDHGGDLRESVEHHASLEDVRRSAIRTAVGFLLEARQLDRSLTARVFVKDPVTGVRHLVRVSVLIAHAIDRP